MHLVVMFGPPAVGKMTVGVELAALTGYRLFHNHMAVEPALAVFDRGTPSFARVTDIVRHAVISEAVTAGLPGLILTYVWALEDPADSQYVTWMIEPAVTRGHQISFVELYAPQHTRLQREGTPERLRAKPSLRDQNAAREFLTSADQHHVLNTGPGHSFPLPRRHLRIDNSELTPHQAARHIVEGLTLP